MVGTKGHQVIDNIPTENEAKKLIKECRNYVEKFLIMIIIFAGMRIGEVVHMNERWIRWNMTPPRIFIPSSQPCTCRHCVDPRYRENKRTGEMMLVKQENTWIPKTKSAERGITIQPQLDPILKDFFSKHDAVIDVVSYSEMGWHIVKNVGRRTGIKVFPHALRGFYASYLASSGVGIYRLKEIMGWSSIATASKYVSLFGPPPEEEVKAFEKF